MELTCEDAMVVEGKKTRIYQVNETEHAKGLLTLIYPHHIMPLYAEELYPPADNQHACLGLRSCSIFRFC